MVEKRAVRTIRDQITDRLRDDILSGRFDTGEPLRESSIARSLGVSRGPVRDALLRLSQEGLLAYRPNRGVTVNEPPDDATRELVVSLRRQIEVYAIRHGFKRFTPEHRRAWGRILERLREACRVKDVAAVTEADVELHLAILDAAGLSHLAPVWKQLCVSMRFAYTRLPNYSLVYKEHAAILDAFDRGDRKGMIRAIEENVV